jgi:hypothetical protein
VLPTIVEIGARTGPEAPASAKGHKNMASASPISAVPPENGSCLAAGTFSQVRRQQRLPSCHASSQAATACTWQSQFAFPRWRNDPATSNWVRCFMGSLATAAFLGRAVVRPTYTTAMISTLIEPIMLRSREPNIPQVDCVLHAHAEFERRQPFAAAHWTAPLPRKSRGMPNIYAVHDLVPLQHPHLVHDCGGLSASLHAQIARPAEVPAEVPAEEIVTISEFCKARSMKIMGAPE